MDTKKVHETEHEHDVQIKIWDCALAIIPLAVVKCAIELRIADVIETHGGSMTSVALSEALGCCPSILHRIMRYLMHLGFFKKTKIPLEPSGSYTHTPLSRALLRNTEDSMAALVLLESSPVMLGPWQNIGSQALINGPSAFKVANGEDLWEYASANPVHSKLINDAMACRARVDVSSIVRCYPETFGGIGSLVDVGGGDGTTLRTLVKACPWVRGINFDLPHVVSVAPCIEGIKHVAGNMFESVPKADAVFLMSVLHDWSDEDCIHIMRKCREAIPRETGKVIIAEAVIVEGEEDKYTNIRLGLDLVMLAHTGKGKERTVEEWEYVVSEAGFAKCTVKHIDAPISVIEAYP
ncbi:O-methyltransferase family protein [Striga hermonthica]|uniref:O-methyltransferase family protein n=1 Tax=Striga hermonthica TaxID=68872 RepID=A0A9N7NE23_STRHE|nr:O-methyltransferase family protein [Striga hermonthica]